MRMRKLEPRFQELVDEGALLVAFEEMLEAADGSPSKVRNAFVARLRAVREAALARIEEWLLVERAGLMAAARLSHVQDALIRVLATVAARYVYPADNPSSAEHIAVLAVGGYGRGTLAPGSDIDLLFIRPYKTTAWAESVVEWILYALWDMRLKVGHATRTVDECIRLSRADLTIRTSILESRLLWGEKVLFDELMRRYEDEVEATSAAEFISAKLAERDERHRRQGQSRYLVEPNVKEGKGALRDLHTLFWIAKYYYRVRTSEELVSKGAITRADLKLFRKCEDFLWSVRCHIHFVTGRPEERLSFEIQREIGTRLGYRDHPGMQDVERFMKHYFLVAKDVGDLTRIICADLEEHNVKKTPRLHGLFRGGEKKRLALKGTDDFVVDHDRVTMADPGVFERDPVNLIRVFHYADKHDMAFHPDLMTLIRGSLRLITQEVREDPEANRVFLEILTSRTRPELTLRRMNEAGVLGRFVLEFGRVVALMQFNMYHHYTVDEHLMQAIGMVGEIERGESNDYMLAHKLMATVQNRKVLYVATFLHDIAKGRPEDHSAGGVRIARRLCPRFGLTPAETETVAWLIQHHLTMSMTAQSRDLGDRKTIADFASIVQSPERLKMLMVLTVADIRAVGPGVWNGWKAQLLRTLYFETEPVLSGGHSQETREERVEVAKKALVERLSSWPQKERERYLARHYPAYWVRVDLERQVAHANLIRAMDKGKRRIDATVEIRPNAGVTELTLIAPDHPRLLCIVFGACAAAGANIVDAQIFTTSDGLALDSIYLSREFSDDEDEMRRANRIAARIENALANAEPLPDAIVRRGQAKPPRAFHLETEVLVSNAWSDRYTVLEVSGLDRPGLLYDLTRAIGDLNLNVASAHIATFGERAVDVFYLTDLVGQKIVHPSRQAAVRRRLTLAFEQGRTPRPVAEAGARVAEPA